MRNSGTGPDFKSQMSSGRGITRRTTSIHTDFAQEENAMGKGNNSQKNDKKSKKPKQDKLKGMKAAAKK